MIVGKWFAVKLQGAELFEFGGGESVAKIEMVVVGRLGGYVRGAVAVSC